MRRDRTRCESCRPRENGLREVAKNAVGGFRRGGFFVGGGAVEGGPPAALVRCPGRLRHGRPERAYAAHGREERAADAASLAAAPVRTASGGEMATTTSELLERIDDRSMDREGSDAPESPFRGGPGAVGGGRGLSLLFLRPHARLFPSSDAAGRQLPVAAPGHLHAERRHELRFHEEMRVHLHVSDFIRRAERFHALGVGKHLVAEQVARTHGVISVVVAGPEHHHQT